MKPQTIFAILLAASLYWMYLLYSPYLMSILIASLLAVSTFSFKRRLREWTGSVFAASALSTLMMALLFFAPLGYFLAKITIYLQHFDPTTLESVMDYLQELIERAPGFSGHSKSYVSNFIASYDPAELTKKALAYAGTIGSISASFVKNAFMIIVFYFFAHLYGQRLAGYFKHIINLPPDDARLLGSEVSSVMSIVFYSILLTAALEGALFGIAVSFMGYNGLLFGILFGFASLIPVVGGALMWVPFSLYELSLGDVGSAVFIALYTILVISVIADTFIKPVIIKSIDSRLSTTESKRNELIIFFAIIAGLTSFGFWGMILGPAITAFFMALLTLMERKNALADTIAKAD
ncbi:AI-2E family transporter [Sulfurimonas diazotrophicus]|uniref:AI-2E family transporter n=1 Tax=Sulfurimonas diazotrophicus TaxID=3131939 RepID=A0ABZ3HBB5_9BACT